MFVQLPSVGFKVRRKDTHPITKQSLRDHQKTINLVLVSQYVHPDKLDSQFIYIDSKMGKKIAFGWYGGKYSHLKFLLPLLPEARHYCEPFGGSAAVLLNREPAPVETYNDIDSELVNFFEVLRNQKDDLIEKIGLTPFSKEELARAAAPPGEEISDLERARRFFVCARQVRTGLAQTASAGRWAHCRLTSRAGMAGAVSRWLGSVDGLAEIAQRLLRVQIENAPAVEVIQRYDTEETLFYCDPPYVHESRGDSNAYAFEMTDAEHRELAETLHNVDGMVALSGYHCDLMNELYDGWTTVEYTKSAHSVKQDRTEVLWVNYPVEKQEDGTYTCQKPQQFSETLFNGQRVA